jgi:hypothetical protein
MKVKMKELHDEIFSEVYLHFQASSYVKIDIKCMDIPLRYLAVRVKVKIYVNMGLP